MSRKKKIPRLIMLYDLSENETKIIPFRVADYTERRKKKKTSNQKEEKELYDNSIEIEVKKPLKEPDPNMHVTNLLPGPHEIIDELNDLFSSDFEKGLFLDNSQSSDFLFLDDESLYSYQ